MAKSRNHAKLIESLVSWIQRQRNSPVEIERSTTNPARALHGNGGLHSAEYVKQELRETLEEEEDA